MSEGSISKLTIKQICNGLDCEEEASEQVIVPVGINVITLKVCKKCLPYFKEEQIDRYHQYPELNIRKKVDVDGLNQQRGALS